MKNNRKLIAMLLSGLFIFNISFVLENEYKLGTSVYAADADDDDKVDDDTPILETPDSVNDSSTISPKNPNEPDMEEQIIEESATDSNQILIEQKILEGNPTLKNAITKLKAFGIISSYPDGTYKLDKPIKRIEFAMFIAKALNLNSSGGKEFTDVPKDFWAASSIYAATSSGYMKGYSDGSFRTNGYVTYKEAFEIFKKATGFSVNDKQILQYKDISKNLNKKNEEKMTFADTIQMISNSLEIDIQKQVKFGGTQVYEIKKGVNLLGELLGIYKAEGQIIANENTSINSSNKAPKNSIIIQNGNTQYYYTVNSGDIDEYLGFYVNYYYHENTKTDENTVLAVFPNKNKFEILEINAKDISESTTKSVVKYYEYEKLQKASIYANAPVIKNGKYINNRAHTLTDADLQPKSGGLKLIDTNKDGDYDIVIINDFKTYVVDTINVDSMVIVDKYSTIPLKLEEKNKDIIYHVTKNGDPVELKDIREWEVLSVATSSDGLLIKIKVSSVVVKGTVTQKGTEINIDDTQYEISKSYASPITEKAYDPKNIIVGNTGIFGIDIDGEIAYYKEVKGEYKYGLLLKAIYNENKINNSVSMKIFTQDGKIIIADTTKKLRFDGEYIPASQKIIDALIDNNVNITKDPDLKTSTYQLIIYGLNSKGNINFIDTMKKNDSKEGPTSLRVDATFKGNAGANVNGPYANAYYYAAAMLFQPAKNNSKYTILSPFLMNDKTIFFQEPFEPLKAQDDDFRLGKKSELTRTDYWVSAYNVSDTNLGVANVVIMKSAGLSALDLYRTPIMLVTNIGKAYNQDDGSIRTKITGLMDSGNVSYTLAEKNYIYDIKSSVVVPIEDIKPGDVIFPKINEKKEISVAGYVRISNPNLTWLDNIVSSSLKSYAKILNRSGSIIEVQVSDTLVGTNGVKFNKLFFNTAVAKVMQYDYKTKKGCFITYNDLPDVQSQASDNCFVFISSVEGVARNLVYFKYDK